MAILKYKTKDEIPSDLQEYAEKDKDNEGAFVVNVTSKAKLNEFREGNQNLRNEVDELKAQVSKYSGVIGDDMDDFKNELDRLKQVDSQVSDGKLKKSADIEEELRVRTEQMRKSYEDKITERDAKMGQYESNMAALNKQIMDDKLKDYIRDQAMADDIGVDPATLPYIVKDAAEQFVWDDEASGFVRKVGGKTILGEDGYKPQTAKEWLLEIKPEKRFFFKQSSGGDAGDNNNAKYGGMAKDDFNKLSPFEQLRIANGETLS